MTSNFSISSSVFPPDAYCFYTAVNASESYSNCPVTNDMVSFLNLTTTGFTRGYLTAYCANPPSDDGCPYGLCPNADVAGPLVRISTYLTNFFVKEGVNDTFWTQILSLYSFLLSCGIAMIIGQLARFHAIIVLAMASSPLNIYIYIYAVRSMFSGKHRLSSMLGEEKFIPRMLVLLAMGISITLFISTLVPSHIQFSQGTCEDAFDGFNKFIFQYFFLLPLFVFYVVPTDMKLALSLPFLLTALAWVIALIRKRKEIWGAGKTLRLHFREIWQVTKNNYPFIHFVVIAFLPFGFWIATVELALTFDMGANDNHFSFSYGQILSIVIAVLPMVEVAKLTPRLWNWFTHLTWVQLITCQQCRRSSLTSRHSYLPAGSTSAVFELKSARERPFFQREV